MNVRTRFLVFLTSLMMIVTGGRLFGAVALSEKDWELIVLDSDHAAIGNADKSRRSSAIPTETEGDLVIPAVIRSRQIVAIDEQAFDGCTNLTSVIIPEGVTNIAVRAFWNCSSLTNVVFPSSLKVIEKEAFGDSYPYSHSCKRLMSVRHAGTTLTIEDSAFSGCSSLRTFDLEEEALSIGSSALKECRGLHDVLLSARTIQLGNSCFESCSALTNGVLSASGVSAIGAHAFANCSALRTIMLPVGLQGIATNTFSKCSSLETVALSTNVTRIAYQAFDSCVNLSSVAFGSALSVIEQQAFFGCSSLTNLTFPSKLTAVGERAFEACSGLERVVFSEGATNSLVTLGARAFYSCSKLAQVQLSSAVSQIGERAFAQCGSLVEINIPSRLVQIPRFAFEDCVALARISFPTNLQMIDEQAFQSCAALTDFQIPTNSVVSVGVKAFYKTGYWNNWPDDSLVVNNGYILGFKGDPRDVTLPDGCREIQSGMFEGMTNLTTITIPSSVTTIGSRAFAGTSITSISIPSVTSLGSFVFNGCSSLKDVALSPELREIPDHAFENCSMLAQIDIPAKVQRIGVSAFKGCTSLRTVSGCEGVALVEDYAFAGCRALEPFSFAQNVDYGVHVYQGCTWLDYVLFPAAGTIRDEYPETYSQIRSLIFPAQLTNLVDRACEGCTALTMVEIPSGIRSVGLSAFAGCTALSTVVMQAGVTGVSSNAFTGCRNISSIVVSGAQPVRDIFPDLFAELADMRIAEGCDALCDELFAGCAALTMIDIPWTVTSIGARAFYGCENLVDDGLLIPEYVEEIGSEAFGNCRSLTAVRYLCDRPETVASDIYHGTSPDLVSAVLQVYKESWTEGLTNNLAVMRWPTSEGADRRRLYWWKTDRIARVTYLAMNGTASASTQYYLKNGGRPLLLENVEDPEDVEGRFEGFLGWFTDPYGGEPVDDDFIVTTSMTLYAHWDSLSFDEDEEDSEYDFSSAHTYQGFVRDGDQLAGTVQIKVSKGRLDREEETMSAVTTATLQLLGEKKITLKGTLYDDASGELVQAKTEREMSFSIEGRYLTGDFDGFEIFASLDPASNKALTRAAQGVYGKYKGAYAVVLQADGESGFSGYVGLSVSLGANGKAKTSGCLPDGTKVSVSTQAVLTEGGGLALPVLAPLYSGKTGGFGFLLLFSEDGIELTDVSTWCGAKGEEMGSLTSVGVAAVGPVADGGHAVSSDVSGFEVEGESVESAFSPDGTEFDVAGSRWKFSAADKVKFVRDEGYEVTRENGNPAGLKIAYTAKTGLFKGSFKVYSETEAGRAKKRTATVVGVVLDGTGYGTAFIKKVGGVQLTIE